MFFEDQHEDAFDEESLQIAVQQVKEMLQGERFYFLDVETYEAVADYFENEKDDFKMALSVVKLGLAQYPKASELLLQKARILLNLEQTKQALTIVQNLEQDQYNDQELYFIKGLILSNLKKNQQATAAFDKSWILFQENNLMEKEEDEDEDEKKEDFLTSLVFEYMQLKEYQKPIFLLKELIRINPENEMAFYELNTCYEETQGLDQYIVFLEKHIQKKPYNYVAWMQLGDIYYKLNLYEKAIWAYDFCLIIKEKSNFARIAKANCFYELGKYEDALTEIFESIQYEQPNSEILFQIADCYIELQQYDFAILYCEKSLEKNDKLSAVWYGKAYAENQLNNNEQALQDIKKAIHLDNKAFEYWHLLGKIETTFNNNQAALFAFQKAIYLLNDEEDEELILDYANFLFEKIDTQQAIDFLQLQIIQHTNAVYAYKLAAFYYLNQELILTEQFLALALQRNTLQQAVFFEYAPAAENNIAIKQLIANFI